MWLLLKLPFILELHETPRNAMLVYCMYIMLYVLYAYNVYVHILYAYVLCSPSIPSGGDWNPRRLQRNVSFAWEFYIAWNVFYWKMKYFMFFFAAIFSNTSKVYCFFVNFDDCIRKITSKYIRFQPVFI